MASPTPIFQQLSQSLDVSTTPNQTINTLTIQTSTTFPLFPTLPTELRLKIWQFSLPGPRIIRPKRICRCSPSPPHLTTHRNSYSSGGPTFRVAHPTLLTVNREARAEALRHYTMIYSVNDGYRSSLAFDGERDVYFPYWHACSDISPTVFSSFRDLSRQMFSIPGYAIRKDIQIRRLAVYEGMLESKLGELLVLIEEWNELEELLIVVKPDGRLVWPHSENDRERERVLSLDEVVGEEDGWGDAVVLNELLRGLEMMREEDEWLGRSLPVVKIVQPRAMDRRDDPFCVRITPLSWKR